MNWQLLDLSARCSIFNRCSAWVSGLTSRASEAESFSVCLFPVLFWKSHVFVRFCALHPVSVFSPFMVPPSFRQLCLIISPALYYLHLCSPPLPLASLLLFLHGVFPGLVVFFCPVRLFIFLCLVFLFSIIYFFLVQFCYVKLCFDSVLFFSCLHSGFCLFATLLRLCRWSWWHLTKSHTQPLLELQV